jgi:hypothetical protein
MPSDALVVGITSLRARAASQRLLHFRRAGHATAALVVDTSDLLPVPTALIDPVAGVAPALSSLRRRMGSARMVGA